MAFTFGIRYLTGRAVSTEAVEYAAAEWPPHPARVFMTLVAAHFEDPPAEDQDEQREADALRWVEGLKPPLILASKAEPRSVVTSFVPVNDTAALTTGSGKDEKRLAPLQSMTLGRARKPRTFPSVRPESDTAYLVWPEAEPDGHEPALVGLCRRVTRIGHSSSLVQMWVLDKPPAETGAQQWYPADAAAEQRLRVTSPGLLDHLCAGYGCGVRPLIGTWKGYRSTAQLADATRGTTWSGSLAVLRLTARERRHRRLDLRSTLAVTGRLQQAFLSAAHAAGFNPIPEWVSGHQADGGPSDLPHLACLPLAFVGRPHADGHLLGLGMAIPAGTKPGDRRLVLRILGLIKELQLGRLGLWELAPELSDVSPFNLQSSTWTGGQDGAARWATVTPIAFDQHPKAKDRASYEREATDIVRRSCVRIGLPEPAQVILTSVSAHLGVPAAHEFPRLKRKDGSERRHRHAILLFNEPVQGPIAIGAGRYRGYGFCRPIREGHRG